MSNIIPLSKLSYSPTPGPLSVLPVFKDKNTIIGHVKFKDISSLFSIKNTSNFIDNTIFVKSGYNTLQFSISSNGEQLQTCFVLLADGTTTTLTAVNGIFTYLATDFYIPLYNYTDISVTFVSGIISELDIFGDAFIELNFDGVIVNVDCLSVLNCPNLKNIGGTPGSTTLIKKIISSSGIYTNITSLPITFID